MQTSSFFSHIGELNANKIDIGKDIKKKIYMELRSDYICLK